MIDLKHMTDCYAYLSQICYNSIEKNIYKIGEKHIQYLIWKAGHVYSVKDNDDMLDSIDKVLKEL